MTTNERIKRILADKGINQVDMALKLGMKIQTFNALVNGHIDVKADVLREICQHLGMSMDEFYDYHFWDMEIAKLFQNRRKELNLTIEEVGKALGVCKEKVERWEMGYIKNMRIDHFIDLATILNANPFEIFEKGRRGKHGTISY